MGAQRVMVDSNIWDHLATDRVLLAACLDAIMNDRVALVVTHVQADELAAIPDEHAGYRDLLVDALEHLAEVAVTAGLVLDVSRLDLSSLFSEEAAERHRQYVGGSKNRAKDALILATAERERIPVVTMESKPRNLARMRQHFPSVEIWSLDRFRAVLGLDPN